MEPLQTFEYKNLKVETFYNGTNKVPNKLYLDGKLIIEDKTFSPSPLLNIDEPKCMIALLSFYTLRSCDASDDFFCGLNCPELLKWNDESYEADEIRLMMSDYTDYNEGDFLKYLQNH